jgi:hypothetical protein
MSMRTFRLVVVAVLTAAALVSAVRAGSPGSWTRVTDTGGQNIDEVGLARTGDGVLHVVWPRRLPTQGQIWHRPISRIGHLGSATTAAARWDAVENPDLVVLPNGTLRLFFAGLGSTFAQGGIQSATAPAFGASWVPQGSRVSASVGAGGPVGATVLSDGTPIFTWASGTDLFVHVGLRSSDPDLNVGPSPRCCFYLPNVERDRASGQVVIAFHSLVEGGPGIFVQPIRPAVGPRRLVPSSLTKGNFVPPDQRTPLRRTERRRPLRGLLQGLPDMPLGPPLEGRLGEAADGGDRRDDRGRECIARSAGTHLGHVATELEHARLRDAIESRGDPVRAALRDQAPRRHDLDLEG